MLLTEFTRPNRFTPDEKKSLSHRNPNLSCNDMNKSGYGDSKKYHTIERKLAKNGWHSAAAGCYSGVYTNPSKDYIIKINYLRDPGFLWFMFLTRKFPNIHFPKMMDVKILFQDKNGKALYAYKIEKLEEIFQSVSSETILNEIGQAITGISEGLYNTVEEFMQKYPESLNVQILKKYLKTDSAMERAINILGKYSKGHAKVDLMGNPYNFMQRNDGTIVIIDPFSSYKHLK